jgi:hypothetical protein
MHGINSCSWKLTGDHDQQQYELVYQDKEGDWLLAQDISWR